MIKEENMVNSMRKFFECFPKKDTKENKLGSIITTAAMVVSQFVNIHEIIHTHQPSRAVL